MLLFTVFSLVVVVVCDQRKPIKIGVLYNKLNPIDVVALEEAAYRVTQFSSRYNVSVVMERLGDTDSYEATKAVCRLVNEGVLAFIGPETSPNSELVQTIATKLHIPNFQIFSNVQLSRNSDEAVMVFNLFPDVSFAAAVATFVRESDWKSYTVLYEEEGGLSRLQDVLKSRKASDVPILLRKMGGRSDYRPILKELKKATQFQILVDDEIENALDLLQQGKEVKGMLEEYTSYFLTSLNSHVLDFGDIKKTGANITSFRIVDINSPAVDDAARDWEARLLRNHVVKFNRQQLHTQTALLYDALNVFITAFETLEALDGEFAENTLNCNSDETTSFGKFISDYLLKNTFIEGKLPGPLTGKVQFNTMGQRINYELKLLELDRHGFKETGSWNAERPKEIQSRVTKQELETKITEHIQRKVFKVASRLGAPYLMQKELDGRPVNKSDLYEGYAVDLIDGISRILNFSYEFYVVHDGNYGSYNPQTKQWNGLIRELLDRKADLAVCDLTITYERRKAVDFTNPFMTLGISILYSKAKKEPPALFSFLEPLSLDVWLYMATSYLLLTMFVFLVARLAKSDWENPHPCNPEPEELENIWNVKNCLWLTLGSIMCQGCDILPKGMSTRMVTSMWWFFSLIMTACYTANLAAFLTMDRMGPTIESAEDLAKQTKIKYGAVEGGATSAFFRDSNFSTYHRMWTQMVNSEPTVFEKSNKDGVKRIRTSKGLYAFLMESSSLEYEKERHCDLVQVGRWLDAKGYGIAMPINAPYRTQINQAVLKMQESGQLHSLKKKWWKLKNKGDQCEKDKTESGESTAELSLSHVGGVFVVLIGGIVVALLIAVCEFLWNIRKLAVVRHLTLREAFDVELRFALNIKMRKKAVTPNTTATELPMLK